MLPTSRPFGPALPAPIRRHVSPATDLTATTDITAAYAGLTARLADAADVDALAAWLRVWSELESLLDEDGVRRGIAMARAADDPAALAAHLDFVDRIAPHCQPLRHRLTQAFLTHPHARSLDPTQHAFLLRTLATRAALHRDESSALDIEEQHLIAEVMRMQTATTIEWDGSPRPIADVEAALDEPDRARREHAWRLVAARYSLDRQALDALFDRLLAVRQAQARAAGCRDVRAHRFRLLGRDYGPDDCLTLHAAIAAEVVPLAGELLAHRRKQLKVASTRPWDLVAPSGPDDVTRPFHHEHTLVDGCTRAIARVDPELGQQFASLARHDLLDLMSRPGKAPGAWQAHLEASGLPFVFASAVGRREDLWTVLHEAGHALHALACADEPLIWNRQPPQEFAELASTAMELLAGTHLDAFFSESASRAARREQLVQAVLFLPHVACVDAFQHWLYTDEMGAAWNTAREMVWQDLHAQHFPGVDWSGLELDRARLWQRQTHIFTAPFYFVEYAIAQLGALELLERYLEDPAATVAAYRGALALGARASLRELLAATGLTLDFSREHVARCMAFVRRELARLAD